MNKLLSTLIFLCLTATTAVADDQSKDAAVGGGLGGAVGGAIGAEIDGRKGAIIGAGVGAAIGAAVTTEEDNKRSSRDVDVRTGVRVTSPGSGHPHGYHCPPGQAKKGRC